MKPLALPVVLVAAAFLTACLSRGTVGNGVVIEENRTVSEFGLVEVDGGFEVQWSAGQPSLTVIAEQNLLPHIETNINHGHLMISEKGDILPTKGIKVVLTSPGLVKVDLNGAVRMDMKELTGDTLTLGTAGAATITASGRVDKFNAKLDGASQLDAFDLASTTAEVNVNGAGRANVNVTGKLKVTINGAGSLTYTGKPKTVEQSVHGVGSIHERH